MLWLVLTVHAELSQANTVQTSGGTGPASAEGKEGGEGVEAKGAKEGSTGPAPPAEWNSHVTLGCFGGRVSSATTLDGSSAERKEDADEGKSGEQKGDENEAKAGEAVGVGEGEGEGAGASSAKGNAEGNAAVGGWIDCAAGMMKNLSGPIKS